VIHVLIRARNAEKYIGKCLRSLDRQTYQDFRVWIFLDAPTDKTYDVVKKFVDRWFYSVGFRLHKRDNQLGLGYNMYRSIQDIVGSSEDIIAPLDGDDYLHKDALRKVAKAYKKHNCLVTYGSYIKKSKGRKTKISRPYKSTDNVRKAKWHGSHLKTFKLHLGKRLTPECFQDSKGNWLDAASDLALMFPIMEMAGLNRCHHISKPIYYWRDGHSDSTKRSLQIKCEKIVRGKNKWQRV